MKKTSLILAAPFAAGLLLAACGSPAPEEAPAEEAAADATTVEETAPAEATAEEGAEATAPAEGADAAPAEAAEGDERTPPVED